MFNEEEKSFFLENGYLIVKNVLVGDHLKRVQEAFDKIIAEPIKHNQHRLLKDDVFLELIEHPPILDRLKGVFGNQVQLLQYNLMMQGPRDKSFKFDRGWHRDFVFPGDRPLTINSILFIDDMTLDKGPTRVIPKSHIGEQLPEGDQIRLPMEGEVTAEMPAGSVVFINSAIWHSGGRNDSDGLRRGIYMYYGYWWIKRYEEHEKLPWQAFENASEQRLRLLGVKMPDRDIHGYDPTK